MNEKDSNLRLAGGNWVSSVLRMEAGGAMTTRGGWGVNVRKTWPLKWDWKAWNSFVCRRRCGDSAPPSAPCDRGTSATSPACQTTWGRAASTQWSTKRSRCPSRPCARPGAFSHCAACCATSALDHADADFLLRPHETESLLQTRTCSHVNHVLDSSCIAPPSAQSLEEHDALNLPHWSLLWMFVMRKKKKTKRIYLCVVACNFIWIFLNLMYNTFLLFRITYSNFFFFYYFTFLPFKWNNRDNDAWWIFCTFSVWREVKPASTLHISLWPGKSSLPDSTQCNWGVCFHDMSNWCIFLWRVHLFCNS